MDDRVCVAAQGTRGGGCGAAYHSHYLEYLHHCLSQPSPQRLPRLWGRIWAEGQLGRPWHASGSGQSAHVAGAAGRRRYLCSLTVSTQVPHAQLGLGAQGGRERAPSSHRGLPLPAQPQGHPRKPLPRVSLHHLGKHTLGKAVPPPTPIQHALGLSRQDPSPHLPTPCHPYSGPHC